MKALIPPFQKVRRQRVLRMNSKASVTEALATLDAFNRRAVAPPKSPRWLDALRAAPEVQRAAVAFLKHRFTSGALPGGVPPQDAARATNIALASLPALEPSLLNTVLEEVAFNLTFAGDFEALAPALRAAFTSKALEATILKRLASPNPRHQLSALEAPYFLFQWDPAFTLSPEGRHAIKAQVDALLSAPDTDPAVLAKIRSGVKF